MKKLVAIVAFCLLSLSSVAAQNPIEKETFVYSEKDGQELHLDK